jgi:hypothetical protein
MVSLLAIAAGGTAFAGEDVRPAAPICSYDIAAGAGTGGVIAAGGGSGSLLVNSAPGCPWTATSDSPWLTITSIAAGSGPGTVTFQAAANAGEQRVGRVVVATQFYAVTQSGSGAGTILGPPAGLTLDTSLALPTSISGGGWSTTLFITNISLAAERFTIRFYRPDGAPRSTPLLGAGSVDTLSGTLEPGAMQVFETADTGALEPGWAVLVPGTAGASRLSGFALIRQRSPAAEAIVPLTGTVATRQFVLLFDTSTGFATGTALANPNTSPLTVTALVRNTAGRTLATETLTLPPLGSITFSMADRFPASASQKGSMLISASPAGVIALGLRFSPNFTFTSFPPLTSPDIQR